MSSNIHDGRPDWADDDDNLVVMDHTWNKVWIINYHRDAAWLRALK